MPARRKFKVGDTVVAIRAEEGNKNVVGRVGKILFLSETKGSVRQYGVNFRAYVRGHNFSGMGHVKFGHGWWMSGRSLKRWPGINKPGPY